MPIRQSPPDSRRYRSLGDRVHSHWLDLSHPRPPNVLVVTRSNPPLEGERQRAWLETRIFRAVIALAIGIGIVASAAGSTIQLITGVIVIACSLVGMVLILRRRRSVAQVHLRRDLFRRPRP